MKTSARLAAISTLVLVLSSCSEGPPPEQTFTQPPVGMLDTGDFLITLHSSPEGPLYTLEDKDGKLVARELTREEFASEFPELREEVSSLWAGNNYGAGVAADDPSRPVFENLLGSDPGSPVQGDPPQ